LSLLVFCATLLRNRAGYQKNFSDGRRAACAGSHVEYMLLDGFQLKEESVYTHIFSTCPMYHSTPMEVRQVVLKLLHSV